MAGVEVMVGVFFMLLLLLVVVVLLVKFVPVDLWMSAVAAGVKVSLFSLVGMRLRKVDPNTVISPLIRGTKAGLDITVSDLESHLLSGGDIENVVSALIAANKANLVLSFESAVAIDLAGRDVLKAVQVSVTPKVIQTKWVSAVAADGIEMKVMARITVRANIDRLVGGAGEETILARVGEGIVTTVGSSKNHKNVLENPDIISKTVLDKGLDRETAYTILSIDIADIDIGKNIGASLQIEQAEADKKIAQAKAEERRALAIAREQEMQAEVQAKKAQVVGAESEVPRALAEALRAGNIGYKDVLSMRNIEADTKMRESFGEKSGELEGKRVIQAGAMGQVGGVGFGGVGFGGVRNEDVVKKSQGFNS